MSDALPRPEVSSVRLFRSYPTYKPSGVGWLGEVPQRWEVKRLKYLANRRDEKVEADEETSVPYIGLENIESWTGKLSLPDVNLVPIGVSNRFTSIHTLFGKLRPYLAKACNPDFAGLCSSELVVLETRNHEKSYLLYQLLAEGFISLVNSSTYGVKMPRASWEFIGSCLLPRPQIADQQAIAGFLDRETAKIDTLMAKKREVIEKLKEKRSALISRTVTRGLPPAAALAAGFDPEPPVKPSGVDWLGDIPAHWEVVQAKHVSSIFVPQRDKPELNTDGEGYPWITVEDLTADTVSKSHKGFFVDFESARLTGSRTVPAGSVLASCVGTFGLSSITERELVINQQLQAYLPTRIQPRFLSYAIRISVPYFEQMATAATISYINANRFSALPVPLPPIAEQVAIAEHLELESTKLNILVAKVEAAIQLLQEQRAALIAAAVTGKIDVRGDVG